MISIDCWQMPIKSAIGVMFCRTFVEPSITISFVNNFWYNKNKVVIYAKRVKS